MPPPETSKRAMSCERHAGAKAVSAASAVSAAMVPATLAIRLQRRQPGLEIMELSERPLMVPGRADQREIVEHLLDSIRFRLVREQLRFQRVRAILDRF